MSRHLREVKRIVRRGLRPPLVALRRRRRDLSPDRWGLSLDASGRLSRGSHALEDLARTHGSPLHVDDADEFAALVERSVAAMSPGVVFVAHRHVDTTTMLARLGGSGVGVLASSIDEATSAIAAGIPLDRVVVAEPAPSESTCAALVGIRPRAIVVSSPESANRVVTASRFAGEPVDVGIDIDASAGFERGRRTFQVLDASSDTNIRLVRIRSDLTIRTAEHVAELVESVAHAVVSTVPDVSELPLEILLSVDVGCPTTAPIPYVEARLNRAFGSDLRPPDPEATLPLEKALEMLSRTVEERYPGVSVSVEPGPGLISSSQFLLTTVLDVKADGDVTHVVLDAGINIAEPVASEYHHLFNASMPVGPAPHSFRLVGPICTPADVLYTNWRLPRAQVGDVLAIMDTGMGFVNASTLFSFPRPAVVELGDGTVALTRRRETFGDLVALDQPVVRRDATPSAVDSSGDRGGAGQRRSETPTASSSPCVESDHQM